MLTGKSCVKAGGDISMCFSSMSSARQGENLSSVLFLLFLDGLVQLMSKSYNGLAIFSEDIGFILSNEVIEVFFKFYSLLYADNPFFLQNPLKKLIIALEVIL